MKYLTQRYKHVQVAYLPHLDGGGRGFGQCYIPIVKKLFGKVDRVVEFCAGPGFLGFSLLAHGLCDSLCLADINPEEKRSLVPAVCHVDGSGRLQTVDADTNPFTISEF